jgi:hypothetical protein
MQSFIGSNYADRSYKLHELRGGQHVIFRICVSFSLAEPKTKHR